MKKNFFIAMSLIAVFPFVQSCGNNSESSNETTDSTVVVDTVATVENPQAEDQGNYISYFNNGEYVFVKIYSNKEKASLFDADKKLVSSGQVSENKDGVLSYNMENGSVLTVSLEKPNMTIKNGDQEKEYVLISPNEEVYVSADKKDSIKAIYCPEESVTLVTKDGTFILKPTSSGAKGAEYVGVDDSTMVWSTKMNNATFKKDGKEVKFTTDGKSKLPESYLK